MPREPVRSVLPDEPQRQTPRHTRSHPRRIKLPVTTAARMASARVLNPSAHGDTISHSPSAASLHSSQARGTSIAPTAAATSAKPMTTALAVATVSPESLAARGQRTKHAPSSALSASCQRLTCFMVITSCRQPGADLF